MKYVNKTIRFIIEIIMAVSIVCLVLILLLESTILNKRYVISTFEQTNYYEKISQLLESNFKKYIQQSGLDEQVLQNIISDEKIKDDTRKIIVNLYDDFYEEVTTTDIRENLKNNIHNSLKDRNLTEQENNSIESFLDEICNEYTSTLSCISYSKQINEGYKRIMQYVKLAKKSLIVLTGILAIAIILLNKKKLYRNATNIGISLLAAGVILIIINVYINMNLEIKYITILNDAISDVIRSIITHILSSILKDGIILSIIGIVANIVANLIHNCNKYKISFRKK